MYSTCGWKVLGFETSKEVATAARGLIGAFRELNPGAGFRFFRF
jgi:hypothetical protein